MSITGPSDIGPAELEVRVSKLRTMEFNHYGQFSVLLVIGAALLALVTVLAGGLYALDGWWRQTIAVYLLSCAGLVLGIRGLRLTRRGLATNWLTCVLGILAGGGQVVALTLLVAT